MGALLLALVGCSPSPHERGGNPQGLSRRDVERDYTECEHKARLANENHFYNQSKPYPFGPGPLPALSMNASAAIADSPLRQAWTRSGRRPGRQACCLLYTSPSPRD